METNRLTKVNVCEKCHDHPGQEHNCICWESKHYSTIELEFKECVCCGNIDYYNIPFTGFNRMQLGDKYFQEELDEIELQARINSFTYQIDSFRTGFGVNAGESAVRVTCIETGKVVECSEHRSRYQNIEQAKRMLNE